jgi:glycosyltransferase involved in cell wall biosynthesis
MVMDLGKQDLDMQFGNNSTPFVAIWMVTYNHKVFIEQAIESVVIQETNFEYKLFVGEDCSSDNTNEICKKLKDKYPNKIELFLNDKNLGANKNAKQIYQQCFDSGAKYVALLEGDDYWTDPLKLQKQVDFLEANPNYVLCFHQVNFLKTNGEIVEDFITKVPENYETIDALARLGNYIHTPSVVFRNVIKEFPFEFSQSPIGDYFLYMMLAEHGKLKYLEEKMAVYREGVGVWSDKSNYFRNFNTALVHTYLFDYFSGKENHLISEILHERIGRFIKNFDSQISKEELTILCSNKIIRSSVFDLLLTNLEQLRRGSIDKKKTGELVQIIFGRAKKRIWKK